MAKPGLYGLEVDAGADELRRLGVSHEIQKIGFSAETASHA